MANGIKYAQYGEHVSKIPSRAGIIRGEGVLRGIKDRYRSYQDIIKSVAMMYASMKPRWDKWDQFEKGMAALKIKDQTSMLKRFAGIPGSEGYYIKEGKAYSEGNIARLGKMSDDPLSLMLKDKNKSLADVMGIGEDIDKIFGGEYSDYLKGPMGGITEEGFINREMLEKRKSSGSEYLQGRIQTGLEEGKYEGTPLGEEYKDYHSDERFRERRGEGEALDLLEREHGKFLEERKSYEEEQKLFESDPRAYLFGERGVDPLTKAFGPAGTKDDVEIDTITSERRFPWDENQLVDPITRAFGPGYTQEERDTMALEEKEMITKNITRKHESMQKTGSALVKDIESTLGFEEYAPRGMDEEIRRSLLSIPGSG